MSGANPNNPITRDKFDAVLFDLDGVITDTAKMHATCWKKIFDEYLDQHATKNHQAFRPFEKVVLVADKLPWINKFPNKPLMYNVAWKTLIYVGCTLVVRFIEHLLPYLLDHEPLDIAIRHHLSEVVWSHFWAIQIWLLVLFLVYSAGRELVRALGSERVLDIFFRPPVFEDF